MVDQGRKEAEALRALDLAESQQAQMKQAIRKIEDVFLVQFCG